MTGVTEAELMAAHRQVTLDDLTGPERRRLMHERIRRAEARTEQLVAAIEEAMTLLGPGTDEDIDSPANMAWATLKHALETSPERAAARA